MLGYQAAEIAPRAARARHPVGKAVAWLIASEDPSCVRPRPLRAAAAPPSPPASEPRGELAVQGRRGEKAENDEDYETGHLLLTLYHRHSDPT